MRAKTKIKDYIGKYKHIWVCIYFLIYMPWFNLLEKYVTHKYYVIHTALDDKIPFIEIFVIPYLIWFLFVPGVAVYFFFTDVQGFYNVCKFMFAGMTVFLIVCTLMPNGLALRPKIFTRDNIFVDMVRLIYKVDTPTNVLPSIHVYNTICACAAIYHSDALKKHKAVCIASYIFGICIILSTMFLKQHSVVDVIAAVLMAELLYPFIYETYRDGSRKQKYSV